MIREATEKVIKGGVMTGEEFVEIVDEIDKDRATKVQVVALLTALHASLVKERKGRQK